LIGAGFEHVTPCANCCSMRDPWAKRLFKCCGQSWFGILFLNGFLQVDDTIGNYWTQIGCAMVNGVVMFALGTIILLCNE